MDILTCTDAHRDFQKRLRAFLAEAVVPHIDQWEAAHRIPHEIWERMGRNGFLCPCTDPAYGGLGGDFLYAVMVAEEMARINFTGLCAVLHSDIVVPYIESYGTEDQKRKYLPECVSGGIVTAIGMTEPDAGSDLAAMTTTAMETGDEIVLNGAKTFISNAVNCDLVVLAARDPAVENPHQALSLYLVEADTPGFKKGEPFEKMGWNSQDTGELFFSDCRIPAENRLGQPGQGFLMLMEKLQQERLLCALFGVFGAEFMLQWTTEHCKTAKAGGKPLTRSQAVQFALVEMATEVKLGRTFTEKLITDHMAGRNVVVETAMAKYWTTETAKRIALRCLDLYGESGMLESCPVARAWRDVRITSIFAGTNEIMKGIAAKFMGL